MQAITLMGMSGVGKTTLSCKLPRHKWFHYSADYRIATHYLSDVIGDFLKAEAMQSPLLAQLLKSDSVYVGSNVTIDNLAPLSAYIGKLGRASDGGMGLDTFLTRQRQHCRAEIAAFYDIGYFKDRAQKLYGYNYFLNDAGGSICELDDHDVIAYLAEQTKIVYLQADNDLAETITQRAIDYPKPLYYNEPFLLQQLEHYGEENGINNVSDITPDDFIRYVIPKLMHHRDERYLEIAEQYGTIIDAGVAFRVRDEADFLELVAQS